MAKRQSKKQLREELRAAIQLINDKWIMAIMDYDDTDAESLEHLAHRVAGRLFRLRESRGHCRRAGDGN